MTDIKENSIYLYESITGSLRELVQVLNVSEDSFGKIVRFDHLDGTGRISISYDLRCFSEPDL